MIIWTCVAGIHNENKLLLPYLNSSMMGVAVADAPWCVEQDEGLWWAVIFIGWKMLGWGWCMNVVESLWATVELQPGWGWPFVPEPNSLENTFNLFILSLFPFSPLCTVSLRLSPEFKSLLSLTFPLSFIVHQGLSLIQRRILVLFVVLVFNKEVDLIGILNSLRGQQCDRWSVRWSSSTSTDLFYTTSFKGRLKRSEQYKVYLDIFLHISNTWTSVIWLGALWKVSF